MLFSQLSSQKVPVLDESDQYSALISWASVIPLLSISSRLLRFFWLKNEKQFIAIIWINDYNNKITFKLSLQMEVFLGFSFTIAS